jgi:hypothetical protein
MTLKALFPIGKTQWSKWDDAQKTAFNEAREAGVPYADAIEAANSTREKKKRSVLDVIESVADVAVEVAGVAQAVSPVVAVVKAARRGRPRKGS